MQIVTSKVPLRLLVKTLVSPSSSLHFATHDLLRSPREQPALTITDLLISWCSVSLFNELSTRKIACKVYRNNLDFMKVVLLPPLRRFARAWMQKNARYYSISD
jgi:hypothetical protein